MLKGFKYGCLVTVIMCLASIVKNSESEFFANPDTAFILFVIMTIVYAIADNSEGDK